MVKNWHDDQKLNCTPTIVLEDYMNVIWKLYESYMKVKCFLAKENYDLIKEIGFFE